MDKYEKLYNEALERARANYKADKEMGFLENCDMLELIFPELRESEDERIRRTLVEYFGPKVQLDFVRGIPIQKIRDWLEKQKDQKELPLMGGDTDSYFDDLRMTTKPLTSREWFDEGMKYAQRLQKEQIEWLMNRLKSLRTDTFQNGNSRPKTSDNWKPSEEQMRALNKVVNGEVLLTTQHESLESLYEQLKKL